MTRLTNLTFGAALLVAVAGNAHAQSDTSPQAQPGLAPPPQTSYLPTMEPKPSGNNYIAPDHFVKPPGYDQNRWNYPYGKGSGPKPS